MAIAFGKSNGSAVKGNNYKFKDGENKLRLIGDVVPRYMYWLKDKEGKDIAIECLSFNRDKEAFDRREKDWVQHYFPEVKCSWSYVMQAIDEMDEDKVVLVNLKKKLFEQIKTAAEDLGDPTDTETGWTAVFKKVKTGPLAFNVEYTLQVLKCKNAALTERQRENLAAAKPTEELVPRLTPDEVHELIKSRILGEAEETPEEMNESNDDIPY